MYGTAAPGTESIDSAITGMLAAGFVGVILYLLTMLLLVILSYYLAYRIMKAAVRNGVVEAIQRTGIGPRPGAGGTGAIVSEQPGRGAGVPPAPAYRGGSAYRA